MISSVVVCIGGMVRLSRFIEIVGRFRLIMFLMKFVRRKVRVISGIRVWRLMDMWVFFCFGLV